MTFSDYQALASRTNPRALPERERLAVLALGLVTEAAEASQHVKKFLREGPGAVLNVEAIKDEVSDTVWYASQLALACGFNFNEIATHNLQKLQQRYPHGFDGGRR